MTSVIEKIEEKFGKITVTRGDEHSFLGMNIKYNGDGTATIKMDQYLREAMADFGIDPQRTVATPAKPLLFDVNKNAPKLSKLDSDMFHSITAKLLYVSMRARMDILLPVCFLCTRVAKCTEEDKTKLQRVLEYVNGTIDLTYTIGANDLGKMRTWVDASYAVHPDMKSHTGGVISFGTGGLVCKSKKQKLNTKSSTEAELVGASDYLPNTLWMKMFLEAQGYEIKESFFEQDNESAIKLEKNGRTSAGPKSRHINIRYFFIKDRVKAEGIEIRHCQTLRMLADFFTKPLQGALFYKLRDVILGYRHIRSLDLLEPDSDEERVGDYRSEHVSINEENVTDGTDVNVPDAETKSVYKNNSNAVTWANVVRGGRDGPKRSHSFETIQ